METDDGLNASYYDFPDGLKSAQDLIEWLGLDFANGNILKSLVREGKKGTTSLYEAQKRMYYAQRHLARIENSKSQNRAQPNEV